MIARIFPHRSPPNKLYFTNRLSNNHVICANGFMLP